MMLPLSNRITSRWVLLVQEDNLFGVFHICWSINSTWERRGRRCFALRWSCFCVFCYMEIKMTEIIKDVSDCYMTGACLLEDLSAAVLSKPNDGTTVQCYWQQVSTIIVLSRLSVPETGWTYSFPLLSLSQSIYREKVKFSSRSPHFHLAAESWIEIRLQSINCLCHYRISSTYSTVTYICKLAQ